MFQLPDTLINFIEILNIKLQKIKHESIVFFGCTYFLSNILQNQFVEIYNEEYSLARGYHTKKNG